MPGLALGAVGTFALSLAFAFMLLRIRCRGIGSPFGPRARYWALFIVVSTAGVSTAVGVLIVAATGYGSTAYAGIVVPAGLYLTRLPPQRDRDMRPSTWSAVLTLPFSRLYDRMGDDMQAWCDTRLEAARPSPQWIAEAAEFYGNQLGRVTDQRERTDLDRWRESIMHKISMVRLIDLDASPARLRTSLQLHPSTQHISKYNDDDLARLARRLETEALNELHLLLAYAYRLGYHRLLIYPYRPRAHRPEAASPRQAQADKYQ